MALEPGLHASVSTVVVEAITAVAQGTGPVHSLATPAMAVLMERAALRAIEDQLEPGEGTVGSHLDVSHLAPSRVGMRVQASATLVLVEGRRLVFEVSAEDQAGVVGRGTHERVVIQLDAFEQKLRNR